MDVHSVSPNPLASRASGNALADLVHQVGRDRRAAV